MERIRKKYPGMFPEVSPVMALPETHLFPGTILPLHIFEERYKLMMAHALATGRMFAVALAKPHRLEIKGPNDFFQIGTVGLIRACIRETDGTYRLLLQGLYRVEFKGYEQTLPFPIARLHTSLETDRTSPESHALAGRVLEVCERLQNGGTHLPAALADGSHVAERPDLISGIAASSLVADAMIRQKILEEPSVAERLRTILDYLDRVVNG